jgi:hypothetical protein
MPRSARAPAAPRVHACFRRGKRAVRASAPGAPADRLYEGGPVVKALVFARVCQLLTLGCYLLGERCRVKRLSEH